MFFVIPEMPSKTFVMVKKLPNHFKYAHIKACMNINDEEMNTSMARMLDRDSRCSLNALHT